MKLLRKIVQFFLRKPVLWFIGKLHSAPQKNKVDASLTKLYNETRANNTLLGAQLQINASTDKVVVISDVHKGNGNDADDFVAAKDNYIAALYYYLLHGYTLIHLGDIEELWENKIAEILVTHEDTIIAEQEFVHKGKLYKIAGNHDLMWRTSKKFAQTWLTKMYGTHIPVHEALLLKAHVGNKQLDILLTHGHQGDKTSDGNKFSKWFVANIWCKVQAFLDINPNVPSVDYLLRDAHNKMMYEWSAQQQNAILITGHTHKPVFASASHIDELKRQIQIATQKNQVKKVEELTVELNKRIQEYITHEPYIPKLPTYYNTGCCCYSDGDITLIEIANNSIKLVKWSKENIEPVRKVLKSISMNDVLLGNYNVES